jgi:purine-nucleoside phosphorylase
MNYREIINESTSAIAEFIGTTPDIAIILGSGLGPLADEIEHAREISYTEIPHFPPSTVPGHEGKLIFGTIAGKTVIAMKGRFHYYEGHEMDIVTLPIRVFAKLGIKNLIVTNAAGGIRDSFHPGTIMIINDQISLFCPSPLRGPNLDEFGPRFKDMTEVYANDLIKLANASAQKVGVPVENGIYSYFRGPQFESPAEIRAIRTLGGDATGMSTVPEAIVARHCGMSTLGISLITNKAAGLSSNQLNHNEVMATAANTENNMILLVKQIIKDWNLQ